jgi:hypothetical protein
MKTLLATLVGLGMLAGTANAQYVRVLPGYGISPEICAPGVLHKSLHDTYAPKVAMAPQGDPAPEEAPAEAAPEAPAEEAPAPEAPQVPK